MTFSLESFFDEPPKHGGRRRGAGRKPAAEEQATQEEEAAANPEGLSYNAARARNEAAKARINEINLAVRSSELVERGAVQRASATLLATLTQALRAIPDNIERTLALPPEVIDAISKQIDDGLAALAADLKKMGDVG